MKKQRKNIRWYSLILLLTVMLIAAGGCKSECVITAVGIIIENQTKQVLTLYAYSEFHPYIIEDSHKIGTVKPEEDIVYIVSDAVFNWPVFAVNKEGNIVYKKTLSLYNLPKVDEVREGAKWVYKAVIPPLTNKSAPSDNITTGN